MKSFDLSVRFETVDASRVKAFVNDQYVGAVRIIHGRPLTSEKSKLTFRCSKNPQKNTVPQVGWMLKHYDHDVPALVATRKVREQLIPIVIRNYLYNYSFLPEFDDAAEPELAIAA
jgi:hypothetical protein